MAGNPYYNNTISLLHFDGTNGSTSFPCTAPTPKTWSVFAGPGAITTTGSQFGSGCLNLANTTYNSIAASTALIPATASFTVNFWFKFSEKISAEYYILSQNNASSPYFGFGISSANKLFLGGFSVARETAALSWSVGTWYHLEFSRDTGNVWRIFRDGAKLLEFTESLSVPQYQTTIGHSVSGNGRNLTRSYIDEVAIISGCLHTADFTPPTYPYADYQLNDKLIPRKELAVRRPLRVNQNVTVARMGL